METAFIAIDPRRKYSNLCMALNRLNELREFLEMNLVILPRIKNLNKKYSVSIISPEDGTTIDWAKKRGIAVIERCIPEQSVNHASEQAIKLSKKWHLYGDLPKLLQIRGVNIAEVLEGELMTRFFSLFKQIELADILLEYERPAIVYMQSNLFPSGRAFNVVAAAKSINHAFLEPMFYRNFKYLLKSYLRYNISHLKYFNTIPQKSDFALQYKVLMDTPSVNYFNALFPVIQEISNRRDCACYIRGKESDFSKKIKNIQRVNIENVNLNEYKEKLTKIRTYYHSKLKKNIRFQNMFAYKGINFWNAIRDEITYLFDRKFAEVIRDIVSFNKSIDVIEPDILVVGSDRSIAMRGHAFLAKEKGIPVLEIQHGLYLPNRVMAMPLSDRIAAGGDYSKRIFVKYGAHEKNIVVTGWPKFDSYMKIKNSLIKKNKDVIDILFATEPEDPNININVIETIGSFVDSTRNVRLIIKPHPGDNEEIYKRTVQKYKHAVLHKHAEDIANLLPSSDVLIIIYSTVGIEAALLDKPIICINTNNERETIYSSSGIAIEVRTWNDLIPSIKDVLYNEEVREELANSRKEFVYEHAYIQDGKSSKRVADLITQMIEESRSKKDEI